jgi:EmrB/QacA subfamily drug resistance transporter
MWTTLAAMTIAASMILVDQTAVPLATPHAVRDLNGSLDDSQWLLTANILPLAAFMVLGGRLGDLLGLRRVFLAGALTFGVATTLAAAAQDMPWMIAARVVQGAGAALMMPTSIAIVSSVFPAARKGVALGIVAGGSASFAALGPVLGGLLTSIDWRLVFVLNLGLAVVAVLLTLRSTPDLRPDPDAPRDVDVPGAALLAVALGALVFGLSEGPVQGWGGAGVIGPIAGGIVFLGAFCVVELRTARPLVDFRLFRHLNFLAANISQMLAGMVELGLGFLLPYLLLLVVGVEPAIAGIALIPATVPIVLAGPLAGRLFDSYGGRWPLVGGYLALAASGVALALAAGEASATALIPGLLLQGIGLGVVLTVNDPTGLTAVAEDAQGAAAGMINTSEQLGGALGIAGLLAVELAVYRDHRYERLATQGIQPTPHQEATGKAFIFEAEQIGLDRAAQEAAGNPIIERALNDLIDAHVAGFSAAFLRELGDGARRRGADGGPGAQERSRLRGPRVRAPLALVGGPRRAEPGAHPQAARRELAGRQLRRRPPAAADRPLHERRELAAEVLAGERERADRVREELRQRARRGGRVGRPRPGIVGPGREQRGRALELEVRAQPRQRVDPAPRAVLDAERGQRRLRAREAAHDRLGPVPRAGGGPRPVALGHGHDRAGRRRAAQRHEQLGRVTPAHAGQGPRRGGRQRRVELDAVEDGHGHRDHADVGLELRAAGRDPQPSGAPCDPVGGRAQAHRAAQLRGQR